ncbi:ParB/RepB/Spo0J family partition protein [Arthrobacter gandavensis]|uniref:ParB/RepB/Spo0J family partition protein n=1 Tax=Arthrobacter gandavensis TaxID=169960 RepID=UPI00188F22EE|nr:ParB/RepB/Spo0J family partition protein [Arthrobacter gandavensis]MBF4994571.1 ParB/RepB/Spo0J family partition protein [Arthrobacter gandavensis]
MTEKRRGLGRGLGALIPSTAEPAESTEAGQPARAGRPVDLFFASVTDETGPERSTAARRGAGINKEALRAPTKKKPATRSTPARSLKSSDKSESGTAASGGSAASASGTADKPASGATTRRAGSKAAEKASETVDDGPRQSSGVAASKETSGSTATTEADAVSRETLMDVPGARFAELPIDSIHPNRKQPRSVFDEDDMSELVHSIREIGVLQPIVVRPSAEGDDEHPYELVMGERRWRASREAGLTAVPAIIRSTQDVDLLRDALLENLHRSQLNPLEEAAAYQQLLDDFECSHEELADRIGRSRPQISNTLRLMKLPPLVQRRLAAGVLSAGHARALLGLNDPAEMEKLAQKIVAEGMSVRATEEVVSLSDGIRRPAKEAKPKVGARHERLDYLANSLSDRLDTSVKITLGARKGKVSIEFASVDDLNRIMSVLNPVEGATS